MAKQKPTEFIERCVCKAEGEASVKKLGLVTKPDPHQNNPKWVALLGTRPNCSILGKRKNYSHKLVFEMESGTLEWLRQFEAKPDNEPNSFGIPADRLAEFNARVIAIKLEDNALIVQKHKNR